MHQTSSPNPSRSNGLISDLFDYRVIPQTGSIASPLQLMTQCRPRAKSLPQLPSALGAPEMHLTCQKLISRQGNKPEREYQELLPGTPGWVQQRQNATWEPAVVVNQTDAPNSCWIMQENGAFLVLPMHWAAGVGFLPLVCIVSSVAKVMQCCLSGG